MRLFIGRGGGPAKVYIAQLEHRLIELRRTETRFYDPDPNITEQAVKEERDWQQRTRPALPGGFELELGGERRDGDRDARRWTRLRTFAWPDNLYRVAARRTIARLIAENRMLRQKGLQHTATGGVIPYDSPGRRFLELLVTALERRDRARYGEPREEDGIRVVVPGAEWYGA